MKDEFVGETFLGATIYIKTLQQFLSDGEIYFIFKNKLQ